MTEDWKLRAACRGSDPDLFFPLKGDHRCVAPALTICARCTVKQECLDYANSRPIEKFGIWGGQVEKQRRKSRWRNRLGLAS